jgi:hypothetical protein
VLAQANEQAAVGHRDPGEAEERRLDRFLRNSPPTFKGRYDPDGAQTWMQAMERIFRAMVTSEDQKVRMLICLQRRPSIGGPMLGEGLRLVDNL